MTGNGRCIKLSQYHAHTFAVIDRTVDRHKTKKCANAAHAGGFLLAAVVGQLRLPCDERNTATRRSHIHKPIVQNSHVWMFSPAAEPLTTVPLTVVASRVEGLAMSGSVPTMAMTTMAMRPAHACLHVMSMHTVVRDKRCSPCQPTRLDADYACCSCHQHEQSLPVQPFHLQVTQHPCGCMTHTPTHRPTTHMHSQAAGCPLTCVWQAVGAWGGRSPRHQ